MLTRAIQKHFAHPVNRFCFHPSNTINSRQNISGCRRHKHNCTRVSTLCTTQTGSDSYLAGVHLITGQQSAAFSHVLFFLSFLFSGWVLNGITSGAAIIQNQVNALEPFTMVDLQRRCRDWMTVFSFDFLPSTCLLSSMGMKSILANKSRTPAWHWRCSIKQPQWLTALHALQNCKVQEVNFSIFLSVYLKQVALYLYSSYNTKLMCN